MTPISLLIKERITMRKRIRLISLSTVLVLFAFLQSCNDGAIYDNVHSFDEKSWGKQDTAVFKLDVQDTLSNRDFILTLRTTTEYLYNNLWVYIRSEEHTSELQSRPHLV